jgi:hypothetical protein
MEEAQSTMKEAAGVVGAPEEDSDNLSAPVPPAPVEEVARLSKSGSDLKEAAEAAEKSNAEQPIPTA